MSVILIFILILSGLFVGFINTLSAGGSIISIALYLALGLSPSSANATNRISILIQTFGATSLMQKKTLLDKHKAFLLAIPTMIGALIGSLFASVLTPIILSYCMGGILIMMTFFVIYNPSKLENDNEELLNKPLSLIHYIIFFGIGLYGGFIQVGTGFFFIITGNLIMGYNIAKTNVLKIFIMFCYTLVSITVFIFDGHIYWTYGILHSTGALLGSWIATKFILKKSAELIRWIIVFVIIITSLHLFKIIDMEHFFKTIIQII